MFGGRIKSCTKLCAGFAFLLLVTGTPAQATHPSVVTEIAQVPKPRPDAATIADPNVIFSIHNSLHTDVVIYALGGSPGSSPLFVDAYWRRYSRGGIRESLSLIESRLAYGVTTKITIPGIEIEMRVNGYPERPITVRREADGRIRALADIGGRRAEIAFVFVTIDNSGVIPRAVAADLYARDPVTKKTLRERFMLTAR